MMMMMKIQKVTARNSHERASDTPW